MFNYAILDQNNICHTILQSSKKRNDISSPHVILENYDEKYLHSRWVSEKLEWEFPPFPDFIWVDGKWEHKNQKRIDRQQKIEMITKLCDYLDSNYPEENEHNLIRQELEQLYGFPFSQNGYDIDNITIESLRDIFNYLKIE